MPTMSIAPASTATPLPLLTRLPKSHRTVFKAADNERRLLKLARQAALADEALSAVSLNDDDAFCRVLARADAPRRAAAKIKANTLAGIRAKTRMLAGGELDLDHAPLIESLVADLNAMERRAEQWARN